MYVCACTVYKCPPACPCVCMCTYLWTTILVGPGSGCLVAWTDVLLLVVDLLLK